jgi:hypothetical protein
MPRHIDDLCRTIVIACATAMALPAAAAAQGHITFDHPRPAIGIGIGASDDGSRSGYGPALVASGTFEVPLGDALRVRVDAAHTTQPLPPGGLPGSSAGETAHISRATLSLTGIKRSLAPLMPYGGAGIGLYRASFDRAPATTWRAGLAVHGGIEVQASDRLAVDGEVGLHVVPQTLYPEGALRGELLARLKLGL